MEKVEIYKRRIKQLYRAFMLSLTLIFLACLPTYPFFNIPLGLERTFYLSLSVVLLSLLVLPIALWLKRRVFPIRIGLDAYWSYTATRRYFWLFSLCLVPFFFSFVIYIIFASLIALLTGYLFSLYGLILIRPMEEDLL